MGGWRRLLARLLVVVAVSQAEDPPAANIKIGDLVPFSINSESQVTVLVLLLEPKDQDGVVNISQMVNLTCPGQGHRQVDNVTETSLKASYSRNCLDVSRSGYSQSGEYTIYPYLCCPDRAVSVYCDFDSDGGGWTVIQRRDEYPQQVDFFRPWKDYATGFGKLSQEFWLGLDHIHALTSQQPQEVRFDLADFDGVAGWAKYDYFNIGDEDSLYRLNISGYSGDVGDGMRYHDGMSFSTKDRDNDGNPDDCASRWKGGWWYEYCQHVSLNGPYLGATRNPGAPAIVWYPWRFFSPIKKTEIKIRPVVREER